MQRIDELVKAVEFKHYKLDENKNVVECDFWESSIAFDSRDRVVGQTELGEVFVSTTFLPFDHNVLGPAPLFFETMIFGGPRNGYQHRYSTWTQAEAGHKKIINELSAMADWPKDGF